MAKGIVFNILGARVKLHFQEKLFETGAVGLYDPDQKKIIIDSRLNENDKLHTLIHEFVHAVQFRSGLVQTSIPQDLHEIMAETIATALIENFEIKLKNN